MVEPQGYSNPEEEIEYRVYNTAKGMLGKRFKVEYCPSDFPYGFTPDIVISETCRGYPDHTHPILIIDPTTAQFNKKNQHESKDKQMKKYAKLCTAIMVTPNGYNNLSYCTNNGYHIISQKVIALFFQILLEKIAFRGQGCEDFDVDTDEVFDNFVNRLSEKMEKCPKCKSKVFSTFIYNCYQYNESFHPDYLDIDVDEHGIISHTLAECDGCRIREILANSINYMDCPHCAIKQIYECEKCGTLFEKSKTTENYYTIITNLNQEHYERHKEKYEN